MADPLVIIGAGQAASQLVASLAQDGFAGEVCLVGDEPHLPYQRPPLSKKFLAGELALDRLYVKPAAFYEKAGSRLLLGRRAERIDRAGASRPPGRRVAAALHHPGTGHRQPAA